MVSTYSWESHPEVPGSHVSVSLRSMHAPLRGSSRSENPSLKLPARLIRRWGITPGEDHIYTRDHGPITAISPEALKGGGGTVLRLLQSQGQLTMPSRLSASLRQSKETTIPVGILESSDRSLVVVSSPRIIALRLGSIPMEMIPHMTEADEQLLDIFTGAIVTASVRREVILNSASLDVNPTDVINFAFPEMT